MHFIYYCSLCCSSQFFQLIVILILNYQYGLLLPPCFQCRLLTWPPQPPHLPRWAPLGPPPWDHFPVLLATVGISSVQLSRAFCLTGSLAADGLTIRQGLTMLFTLTSSSTFPPFWCRRCPGGGPASPIRTHGFRILVALIRLVRSRLRR